MAVQSLCQSSTDKHWALLLKDEKTIPALGCGLGGLPWSEVEPMLATALKKLHPNIVATMNPAQWVLTETAHDIIISECVTITSHKKKHFE